MLFACDEGFSRVPPGQAGAETAEEQGILGACGAKL